MFSSRSLLAAAALASVVLGASCAYSDTPTSTGSGGLSGTGGDALSGVGGAGAQGQGGDAQGPGPVTTGGGAAGSTSGGGDAASTGQGGDGQGGDGDGGGILASFDATGTELVSGAVIASSPGYTVILSVGQPAPVQTVMTSSGYRFEGGLLGVNGSLP